MSYSGSLTVDQDNGADAEAKAKQLKETSQELTKILDGIEKKLASLSLKALSAVCKTVADSFEDSFKSMERSVTRGSQTIINAMNEARASINRPDLNESIVALGGMFENALGGIAQLAVPVAQNLELIAGAVMGIGTALATWKIAGAIGALQTVLTLTDPIKLALAAFVGLITLIGTAIGLTQASDETMADLTAAKERTAAIQEQTEAYNKRVLAAQASVEGDMAELNHTKALASELFSLMDSSGKIQEADQARADYLISVLNPALGTEIQMIDGQVKGHEELQAQIAKTLEMKQAELLLSSYEEQYTEAIRNRMQAYQEAGEAKAALDQAQMEYDQYKLEYQEKYAEQLSRINELESAEGPLSDSQQYELDRLKEQVDDSQLEHLQEILAETQAAYDASSQMVEQYNLDMQTYEAAQTAFLQGNAQEAIRILNERSLAYAQAAQKDGASAQEQQQALMNGYEGQLQAIQLYLQHAKEGKIQFNESELQLMVDHADDLYDQAVESGVKFVDGQMEGMDGQKKDLTGLLQGISNDLVDIAEDKVPGFELSGNHYILGLKKGIDTHKGQIFISLHQLASEMLATMQKDFDEHSPSRKAFKIGAFLSIGLANGVKDELDSTLEASKALAASVLPPDFGRTLAGRAATLIGGMQAAVAGGVGLRAFGMAGTGFGAPVPALAAAGGGGSTVNYYSANIDAKNVREWNDVVKVFQNHKATVRKGYTKG